MEGCKQLRNAIGMGIVARRLHVVALETIERKLKTHLNEEELPALCELAFETIRNEAGRCFSDEQVLDGLIIAVNHLQQIIESNKRADEES